MKYPFGNPTRYYIAKSMLWMNPDFSLEQKTRYIVCLQETLEEVAVFTEHKNACAFIEREEA